MFLKITVPEQSNDTCTIEVETQITMRVLSSQENDYRISWYLDPRIEDPTTELKNFKTAKLTKRKSDSVFGLYLEFDPEPEDELDYSDVSVSSVEAVNDFPQP